MFEAGSSRASQVLTLRSIFNNPSIFNAPTAADSMTRGMSLQPMQTFDNSITEEVVVH
jgi:hypothetical protein